MALVPRADKRTNPKRLQNVGKRDLNFLITGWTTLEAP